jgi:hypothetical protein
MNRKFQNTKILATAVCIAFAQCAYAADPEVTPYRPGAGSPAVLSATGYFELEAGYDYAKVEGVRSDSLGLLLKYGLTDTLGVLIGVNPYVRVKAFGAYDSGVSDASVGLKWVSKLNDATAIGAQLVSTLPTGSNGFGSDNANVTLTGLAGFDFAGMHSDLNLGVTRFGDAVSGTSRNRLNWSASIGRPLSGPISGALEVSGTRQSGSASSTQYLGSLAYAVNKKLVLDAYYAHARSSGISGNGFGVGMTYLFAK